MMMAVLLESALRSLILGGLIWLGLTAFRVRHPGVKSLVWTVALIASLAMPVLVEGARQASPHWPSVTLPFDAPAALPNVEAPQAIAHGHASTPAMTGPSTSQRWAIGWRDALSLAYAVIASLFLVRLVTGLALTWRIRHAARPLAGHGDVRISPKVTVPVTFGGTVLLPAEASDWSAGKRQAVLAHERSHVARGDFYVQLLAQLNRAIFWFNPFAWWVANQLAELAETACDDAAVTELGTHVPYAEILLDIAGRARRVPAGVAMARSGMVGPRIERILAGRVSPPLGRRTGALIVFGLMPLIVAAAVAISAPAQNQDPKQVAVDPKIFDRLTGYYELNPAKAPDNVVRITREGDHLFTEDARHVRLELFAESESVYFVKGTGMKLAFVQQGDQPATAIRYRLGYLDDDTSDDGLAKRVDEAEMKRAEARIEQRKLEQAKPRVEVKVDPRIFDRYVGQYQYGPVLFTVDHEGDDLFVAVNATPKLHVYPEGDHDFFFKVVPAQISFVTEGDGPATKLILHQNGMDMPAKRADAAQARQVETQVAARVALENKPRQAVAIDPKILDDYVGHYQLTADYIFTVSREGNQLSVALTGQPAIEVYPENDHEFFYTVVKAQITFDRDNTGKVTQLILHQNGQNQVAAKTD